MKESSSPNIGQRIRMLRDQRGLSLRALSEQCGLSINAISKIERGENSPTVASLHMLATALRVPISDFFLETGQQTTVFVRRDRRLQTEGQGMLMESLGIGLSNQQIEPFLLTVEPETGNTSSLISHPGEELVYCLEGEIEYHVSGEIYLLEAGDSLLFKASQPHGFYNATQDQAVLLLVFQSTESSYIARQRHLDI